VKGFGEKNATVQTVLGLVAASTLQWFCHLELVHSSFITKITIVKYL